MKRGEMYVADLNKTVVGSEQSGLHPVLIVQNDIGNKYSPTVICAVMTSKLKKITQPTHVLLTEEYGLLQPSIVLFEQICTIDKSRIKKYIGYVPENIYEKALKTSLGV